MELEKSCISGGLVVQSREIEQVNGTSRKNKVNLWI